MMMQDHDFRCPGEIILGLTHVLNSHPDKDIAREAWRQDTLLSCLSGLAQLPAELETPPPLPRLEIPMPLPGLEIPMPEDDPCSRTS